MRQSANAGQFRFAGHKIRWTLARRRWSLWRAILG